MKKRIRFVINTLDVGGAERVLINLVCNLPKEKYDISLVSITGGVFEKELPSYVHYKKIIKTKNKFLKKFFQKIVYNLPYSLISSLYLRGEYDIEIAYMHGFPTRIVSKKCNSNSKTLAFVHGDFWTSFSIKSFYSSIDECIEEYKKFDKVCFVSNLALEGFIKRLGNTGNLMVVHNIIDYKQVLKKSLIEAPVSFSTDGLKLVTVGRLTEVKGYKRLLNTVKLAEEKYNFELIIIGDGEEKTNLEKQICDNNIKSVRLVGFQENPHCIVSQADWFICSSYQEAYSTSVAEAVCLGVPVLTTKCAGMDEILDNGKYGIICENDDFALSEAFFKLFEINDNSIYKVNSIERSRELQSVSITDEYEELFDNIL